MAELRIALLGPPRIEVDSRTVHFSRRKGLALLAYLAVSGEAQRRDTLATLLWPESGQGEARTSLRGALLEVRELLGVEWLETERETVALRDNHAVRLDVRDFENVMAAERGKSAGLERLAAAMALYRGDFLEGFSLGDCPAFDDWQFFQAESYRRQFGEALDALVQGYEAREAYAEAINFARRRVALDGLHEPAQRALMRLYARNGQHAAALRQYDECARLLDEELGAAPEAATTALSEAIRQRKILPPQAPVDAQQQTAQASSAAALPKPAERTVYALPAQVSSFVGRDEEVEMLLEALAEPHPEGSRRLLTITGAGGMGKTRLALRVAGRAAGLFSNGVAFVPLAGTNAPEHIAAAVGGALGLSSAEGGGTDIYRRVLDFARDQELLLVLDNLEHLIEGAALLDAMLQHAPRLRLLVTSRERLNLAGEWVFPIQGLAYPRDEWPNNQTLYPGLDLFVQRARQAQPDFDPAAEWKSIAAICRLVEGMPLGIELAAAWTRMMSCAEIVAELERSSDLPAAPVRHLPAQHRSLRAVFERSWWLLSAEEQNVLRRVSVFRGGFTREAAHAVAGATAPLLVRLLDCSLIRRQATGRFDMHELLRQFVIGKLEAEPDEWAHTLRRHAAHYSEVLARMPSLFTPGSEAAERLEDRDRHIASDIDNVRAAWAWTVQHQDARAIRPMIRVLFDYFLESGAVQEARTTLDEAIAAFRIDSAAAGSSPQATEDLNAERAAILGSLLLQQAEFMGNDQLAETAALQEEGVALLRRGRLGPAGFSTPQDRAEIAWGLTNYGRLLSGLGRMAQGMEIVDEGILIFRDIPHPLGIGIGLVSKCMLQQGWGRIGGARQSSVEATTILEPLSERWYWQARHMVGVVLLKQGDYAQSESIFQEAVRHSSQLQTDDRRIGFLLRNLGDTLIAQGKFDQARASHAESEARLSRLDMAWQVAIPLVQGPGDTARLQGDLDEAERWLTEAVATARRVGFQQRIATNLDNLSRLRYDQGRYAEAKALLDEALAVARRIDFRFAIARILCQLGFTAAALDEEEQAVAHYTEALRIALDEEIHRVALDVLVGVAALQARRGQIAEAAALATVVREHPFADFEAKRRAKALLAEIAAHSPAATAPPPDSGDFREIGARLLREGLGGRTG